MKKILFYTCSILSVSTLLFSCGKIDEKLVEPSSEQIMIKPEKTIVVPNAIAKNMRANKPYYTTYYGNSMAVGSGSGRTWVNIDRNNVVLALGIELSANATNVPSARADFNLGFHSKAMALIPFDHVTASWLGAGQGADAQYYAEHFEFLFSTISASIQNSINGASVSCNVNPPSNQMPSNYARVPGGRDGIGATWKNMNAPENTGGVFSHSFLFGSYNGGVSFYAPTITKEALANTNSSGVWAYFGTATEFAQAGKFYPRRYTMWKDAQTGNFIIGLDEMVKR